jgi:hypothetical protein
MLVGDLHAGTLSGFRSKVGEAPDMTSFAAIAAVGG